MIGEPDLDEMSWATAWWLFKRMLFIITITSASVATFVGCVGGVIMGVQHVLH